MKPETEHEVLYDHFIQDSSRLVWGKSCDAKLLTADTISTCFPIGLKAPSYYNFIQQGANICLLR